MAKRKKKIEVVWNDEDSVLAAMAEELEIPVEDLSIKEDYGLSSFAVGAFYLVTSGREEYQVAEDEDSAHKLAVAVVAQDLEHEPDIFNQDFIERHIDVDRLRRDLSSDLENARYEDLKYEADRHPLKFMQDNNIDIPEPSDTLLDKHFKVMADESEARMKHMGKAALKAELRSLDPEDQWSEIGEEPEVPDEEIQKIAEQEAEEQLKDPLEYLRDIYGDEAVKKAIDIAGIDIDAAAEAAVDEDGVGHFLAGYDGHMHNGPGGIVWWRSN